MPAEFARRIRETRPAIRASPSTHRQFVVCGLFIEHSKMEDAARGASSKLCPLPERTLSAFSVVTAKA